MQPEPDTNDTPQVAPGTEPVPGADSYRRLAEVFHAVLSEESLDAVLDRVADALADLIPHDTLTIYRADEGREVLVPVLARDTWAAAILETTVPFGVGVTGAAVERREPILVHQAQLDPRAQIIPGTPPDEPEALVSVPLVARGRVKGALNVYRLGVHATFGKEELELVTLFGDAAALALDNVEVRERLEHQAQTDSLTGLYNHRQFHERLRAEINRATRSHEPVAVLMLDVDDFKRVNDIYGHAIGDQVLVRISEILTSTVRGSDLVSRLGGEEFGVILPSCDTTTARALAGRLSALLSTTAFEPAGTLTVSVGVALAPENAMNPRELAACAESAMMTAKALGKGRIVVFGEEAGQRPEPPPLSERDARSIAHLKLLQGLVGKLNRLNDVAQIGTTIVSELRTLVDYHNGRVYLRDGDQLLPIAFRGELGDYGDETAEVLVCAVGEGITGHVAETGRSLLVPNALECEFAVQISGTPEIEESLVAVPLRYGERVIGVIVISKLGVDQFDDADVRLIEVLAGHASVALENARLYEAERREAERARESAEIASALLELTRVLADADSVDDVVRRLAASSALVLGAPRASIWLQDTLEEPLRLAAQDGYEGDELRVLASQAIAPTRLRALVEPERPVVLAGSEAEVLGAALAAPGGISALASLRLDAGRVGLVTASWQPPAGAELEERTIRLLAGIADQATLAIGNAGNFESLERTFLSTVEALANALEANDEYTSSHARSLTDMALRLGEEMGLDGRSLKRLELGALFHDIGKIGIPSEILAKPGPLTPTERSAIELHPSLGERILAPIERLADVRPIVRHCHERWNGTGYPDGLAGEEIPLESRIIFVCDSFHAMTTDRPYRHRLSRPEAFRRLEEAAGTQFDPDVVERFVRVFEGAPDTSKVRRRGYPAGEAASRGS
jgi:diguanylate cyclase (GGDEF)-like protein